MNEVRVAAQTESALRPRGRRYARGSCRSRYQLVLGERMMCGAVEAGKQKTIAKRSKNSLRVNFLQNLTCFFFSYSPRNFQRCVLYVRNKKPTVSRIFPRSRQLDLAQYLDFSSSCAFATRGAAASIAASLPSSRRYSLRSAVTSRSLTVDCLSNSASSFLVGMASSFRTKLTNVLTRSA